MLRRRLILKAALGAGAASLLSWVTVRSGPGRRVLRPDLHLHLDRRAATGRLTSDELNCIGALAETLVPEDETSGAGPSWVREFVDGRTSRVPGWLPEYRAAADLLDRYARELRPGVRRFADLAAGEREVVLQRHFDTDSLGDRVWFRLESASEEGVLKERCRQLVMKDLLVNFYGSPGGWAVIGYTNYPGVPGDPREYTAQPPNTLRRS